MAANPDPPVTPGDRILYENDGDLVDEIVCHDVTFHMEVMSDTCVWVGVYRGKQALMVNIFKQGSRGPVVYRVEDDGQEPWVWDREQRHPREDEPPKLVDVKETSVQGERIEP